MSEYKYTSLVRLQGGLGDVIRWSLENNRWNNLINLSETQKFVITNFSHNRYVDELIQNTPFSHNFLIYNHNQNIYKGIIKEDRLQLMAKIENDFLIQHNIDCNIKRDHKHINTSGQQRMKKYLTIIDQNNIQNILKHNKPILIISAAASGGERDIPAPIMQEFCDKFANDYIIVQIGRTDSNFNNKQSDNEFTHPAVYNLIDKMTVGGNLYLIDICAGMLACDSSMYLYGAMIDKHVLFYIRDRNELKYGFVDITKRESYFKYIDNANIIVIDRNDNIHDILSKFQIILPTTVQYYPSYN